MAFRDAPRAALALLVGACTFQPAGLTSSDGPVVDGGVPGVDADTTDGPQPDAPVVDAMPPIDASPPDAPPPVCSTFSRGLLACWEFEGDGVDGSGNGNTAALANVGFTPAAHRGMGVVTSAVDASRAFVAASDGLDVTAAATIEAWVLPTLLPSVAGERVGIWDTDGQMSLFIYAPGSNAGGMVRCSFSGIGEAYAGAIVAGVPHHLACTYDSATGLLDIYIDGTRAGGGTAAAGTMITPGNTSSAIGANAECLTPMCVDVFSGTIDSVRIWNLARTKKQLCDEATLGVGGCP